MPRWTTDLDNALSDSRNTIYFDAQLTSLRERSIAKAIDAGKHIYTEKPLAFGRILSVRGEFGYWVFEGDWQQAQRPSWNYRSEDGDDITVDMFCHWNYVLENLFGTAIPRDCRRRRIRYFRAGGRDHRPTQLIVVRPRVPRRARRVPGRRHPRQRRRRLAQMCRGAAGSHPAIGLEPRTTSWPVHEGSGWPRPASPHHARTVVPSWGELTSS